MFVAIKPFFFVLLLFCTLISSSFEGTPTEESVVVYKKQGFGRYCALIGFIITFICDPLNGTRILPEFIFANTLMMYCLGENWEVTECQKFYEKLEDERRHALKIKELGLVAMQ